MSITITPSMSASVRNLDSAINIKPVLSASVRNLDSAIKMNQVMFATVRNMDEELGEFEYHSDILGVYGLSWQYQNPGITDSLTRDAKQAICSVASKTGVAVCLGETNTSCFEIPVGQKEIWMKLDVYAYDEWRAGTGHYLYCGNGGANGFTGIKIRTSTTSYNDGIQYYVNGSRKSYGRGSILGFHSIMVHFVSDATSGRAEYYIDGERVYTFTGNVNNGDSFEDLYIQCKDNRALFSNIIISPVDYFPKDNLNYIAEPYVYYNAGTADKLITKGTTVQTDEMSHTGTAFYQTQRVGCIGMPIMDEVWIKFDLYHKAGTSRFRCYAENGTNSYVTGICLAPNSSNVLALFVDDTNTPKASAPVIQPDTIQTYIMHMKVESTRVITEVWVDRVKVIDNVTETVAVPAFNDIQLQTDNSDNLFSDVTVSNSSYEILYQDRVFHNDIDFEIVSESSQMIITHADIVRKSSSFYYENPGTADLITLNGTTVLCSHASKTGVAFFQSVSSGQSCFDIPTDKKELWVKFDAYLYKRDAVLRCWSRKDGNSDSGFRLYTYSSGNCTLDVFVNNSRKISNTIYLAGLHSFKLHLVCHATNGLLELFIDDDITPYYSFNGDVQTGSVIDTFVIHCTNQNILISNLIITDYELSIADDVPYNALPFVYKNIGTAEGLATSTGVTIETTEKSNTGVAFYQTTKDIGCVDAVPMMDEVWAKFDVYHKSGLQKWRVYASGTDWTGIYYNGSNPCITIGGNDDSTKFSDIANTIHTYLMHVVSNDSNTLVEVWRNGEFLRSWSRTLATPLRNFNFQSDGSDTVYSNILISNLRQFVEAVPNNFDVIREVRESIVNHGDIDLTTILPGKILFEYHSDVMAFIGNMVATHADALATFVKTISAHADIELNVEYNAELFEYHSDIEYGVTNNWHYDTLVYRSDSVEVVHADIKRLLSRELDGLGEGVATHQTIDLGKEMTVGIGISIDGEGYAMIRTAGEDRVFTGWENYIPCERLCRYIDVQLHVRMVITSATMIIDKRTTSLTISKHLAAGNNTVSYGETFCNVPAVIPTAIGDGLTAYVVSKAVDSCVINIKNANNQSVEGDVDILVRGW